MAIVVGLDGLLAQRKMSVGEVAQRVGITPANVAVVKNGRATAFARVPRVTSRLRSSGGISRARNGVGAAAG